jgi:hypothetical protein
MKTFHIIESNGLLRKFEADMSADGKIQIFYEDILVQEPSERQLVAAAIALQAKIPAHTTAEVIDLSDHF